MSMMVATPSSMRMVSVCSGGTGVPASSATARAHQPVQVRHLVIHGLAPPMVELVDRHEDDTYRADQDRESQRQITIHGCSALSSFDSRKIASPVRVLPTCTSNASTRSAPAVWGQPDCITPLQRSLPTPGLRTSVASRAPRIAAPTPIVPSSVPVQGASPCGLELPRHQQPAMTIRTSPPTKTNVIRSALSGTP